MRRLMSSTLNCVIVIMLTAVFDFWIVKNVSGRYLVGLRWWSFDNPKTGKQDWRFECRQKESKNNKADKAFFWGAQFLTTAFWALFFIINVISFDIFWSTVTGFALVMAGTNMWAYYNCSRGKGAFFR